MADEQKFKPLLMALKEVAVLIISAVEDFLDTPYDRSTLAKRRERVKQ